MIKKLKDFIKKKYPNCFYSLKKILHKNNLIYTFLYKRIHKNEVFIQQSSLTKGGIKPVFLRLSPRSESIREEIDKEIKKKKLLRVVSGNRISTK
jgi:hypothetical protein